MQSRRDFLRNGGLALAGATLAPRLALANAATEARLILVLLRGGLDGLHAMPPFADQNYRRLRPTLAINPPGARHGALDLNGYFGLHPALKTLHDLYLRRELALLPAAATAYRDRSHFDAQNMLENGSGKPYGARDGWLNRALAVMAGRQQKRLGLALGPTVPLILQGDSGVQTWADSRLPEVDDDFLGRLAQIYGSDPVFARALADARATDKPDLDDERATAKRRGVRLAATAAADLLARPEGPRIAVLELGGWDTHFAQIGRLQRLFGQLDEGIQTLHRGLGDAWRKTAILIVSEFGRTAAENGSRGTDHGTGGIAMLAGGAVAGGRIVGQWPGLSADALYEGRDLRTVNAYESLFKGVLAEHLGLGQRDIDARVFPDAGRQSPLRGLIRS